MVTSNTFTHTYSAYSPGIRGFEQSGGTHVVRGTLSLQSSYTPFPGGYTLSGGELIVNNIEVGANAIFWQGGGRLTNNGTITLAGGHWKRGPLAQRTQRFGRLQLQAKTNSSFTFSTGALATVRFAASAATAWNPQARLIFHGWQGLTTGGGQHQIYFGTNRNGLTPQQLSQIRFRDPKGFAPGEYPARHRGTGEIVPNARPVITLTRDGQDILVQWPAGYVLQTATNVPGPFSDVEATSPYRRPTASESQRYFRLRQ